MSHMAKVGVCQSVANMKRYLHFTLAEQTNVHKTYL